MSFSGRFALLPLIAGLGACQTLPPPPAPLTLGAHQIAVLQQQGFVQSDDGWAFDISSRLLFPTDDSTIDPDKAERLSRIAAALCGVEIRSARVEGHTDSVGTEAYNRALSLRRAEAVAAALSNGGMPRAHLRAEGLGESDPVEDNATSAGRAENRRVVIIVPDSLDGQGSCTIL